MGGYGIVAAIDYLAQGEGGLALFFPRLVGGFENIVPNWLTWFLISCQIILTAIGIFIQFRMTGKNYQHKPLIDFKFGRKAEDDDLPISSQDKVREPRRRLFYEE